MRASAIVSTYNNTRALDLVLCALSRQSRAPEEIWIADDGSTEETAALVRSYEERFGGRLHHVWQSDSGYNRRVRIANEAVRRATGDYLIFLDGDSVPHSHWTEDHMVGARKNTVLCGRRVKLGPELSAAITRDWIESGWLESGKFLRQGRKNKQLERWLLGIRLPALLPKLMYLRARKLMGVNFSMPREVFEALNGWEEDNPTGRRDDTELELRIKRSRFKRFPLLHRALVYHLDHPEAGYNPKSQAWLAEHRASDHKRARVGLDSATPFDPAS